MQMTANIFIGLTAPTSSLVPTSDSNTLVLDPTGQPTSNTGFHAGLIEAPTMPTVTEKLSEIEADQFEGPIDVTLDAINAEIDFVLKETNLLRLQTLLSSAGLSTYTALGASQALQIGGQSSSQASPVSVTAISARRDNTGKFAYWMLYKAVLGSAIQFTFERKTENLWKCKFKGMADTSRVMGDELMQIVLDA